MQNSDSLMPDHFTMMPDWAATTGSGGMAGYQEAMPIDSVNKAQKSAAREPALVPSSDEHEQRSSLRYSLDYARQTGAR